MTHFFTAQDFANQTDAVMIKAAEILLYSCVGGPNQADFINYSGSVGFCNYFTSLGFNVNVHYEGGGSPPIHTTITFY